MPAGDPRGYVRTIDLIGALSLASDLSLGLSAGHGVRGTYIGMRIAADLGLPAEALPNLFYAELLMDVGCTAWAGQIAARILSDENAARRDLFFLSDPSDVRDVLRWLVQHLAAGQGLATRLKSAVRFAIHGKTFMTEGLRNTSEVAARLAGRLGMPPAVQEALRFVFEQWDGSGPQGRRGEAIPIIARLVHATLFLEVLHQIGGRAAAVKLARVRRGTGIDPAVADSFERLAQTESFWRGLEGEAVWTVVCQMEPDSPYRFLSEAKLDDAATAFADFADLKSFYSAGHSRRVAALVERMAPIVGVAQADLASVRRAALLHDVGLVALPAFVLHKPENKLTAAEREALRLHPYHAERILARVPAFTPVVPLVGAHHEQPDGGGYFRGISHPKIPVGARLITVADRFDELTHARPERPPLDADAALAEMRRDVPAALCAECFAALGQSLAVSTVAAPRSNAASVPNLHNQQKMEWPAGLTDREVEVVRLLATGASRRAMAHSLSVSEHTIRHHLEHIYDKIDVHTRVEATLFAIEHGLLR